MTPSPAQPLTRAKPIIFSAPMIRAILADRKTVTRRIVKSQPKSADRALAELEVLNFSRILPGDVLWVREAWQYADWSEDGFPTVGYRADDSQIFYPRVPLPLADVWAKLSDPENVRIDGKAADRHWRSPIHMPRWASRLTLEVASVRAERVQEITEAECILEGFVASVENGVRVSAMEKFLALWNELNGRESWDENPWVRRIEFRRIEQ